MRLLPPPERPPPHAQTSGDARTIAGATTHARTISRFIPRFPFRVVGPMPRLADSKYQFANDDANKFRHPPRDFCDFVFRPPFRYNWGIDEICAAPSSNEGRYMTQPSRTGASSQRTVPGWIVIAVVTFVGVVLELAALQDRSAKDPYWVRVIVLSFPPLIVAMAVIATIWGRRSPKQCDSAHKRLRLWRIGAATLLAPRFSLEVPQAWSLLRLPAVVVPLWVEVTAPFIMFAALAVGGACVATWVATASQEG